MTMNEYTENKPPIKARIGNFGAKIDRKGQACGGDVCKPGKWLA